MKLELSLFSQAKEEMILTWGRYNRPGILAHLAIFELYLALYSRFNLLGGGQFCFAFGYYFLCGDGKLSLLEIEMH